MEYKHKILSSLSKKEGKKIFKKGKILRKKQHKATGHI